MSKQDDIPTSPQTPVTLGDLRDAIFTRLDEKEAAQDARLDAMEERNVDRHVTIMTTLQHHEKRLNGLDTDVGELRGGRFPQLPLWALVAVAGLMWLTISVGFIYLVVTHGSAAHG